jgi:alkylation response protein AidB-like acyl-CoA dehydrogenase
MDLTYSTEQRLLESSVRDFARDYLVSARGRSLAAPDGLDRESWRAIVELGWLAAGVPEDLGGLGGSVIDSLLIHEGVGFGLIVEPLLSAYLAAKLMSLALPRPLAESMLKPLLSGEELWAVAHEEPAARGDCTFVEASARPMRDMWRLSGCKSMVLGAPSADRLIVSARLYMSDGLAGEIALFRLDRPQFAQRLKRCRTLDGQHAADLDLRDLDIGLDARIGAERCALSAVVEAYDHAILASCAEAVGAMDAAVTLTAEHLKNRKQFGAPLASFQVLQHKLADMVIAAEQARSILLYGAAGIAQGNSAERGRAVSAAKVRMIESAKVVGTHAIQLHGGIGITEEHIISHYFRRLFAFANRFGGTDRHLARFMAA